LVRFIFGDDEFTDYIAPVGIVLNLSEIFKMFAQSQMIRHVTTHHFPKVRTMVSYLNMAEFVNDNIVRAGWWCFDQVEIEGNTFGLKVYMLKVKLRSCHLKLMAFIRFF
jgi:hypothetical protein